MTTQAPKRKRASRWHPETPTERFSRQIEASEQGCLIWTGKRDKQGYGRIYANGEPSYLAHRFAFENFVGAIPEGHHVHHCCGNRSCVNHAHLEAVNTKAHAAEHARTHCIHGHLFDERNTRIIKGKRHCRKCDARRQREYRDRRAAA